MIKKLVKIYLGLVFVMMSIFLSAPGLVGIKAVSAASNLNGRILLQVQDKGQAWYVDPVSSRRYFLGRPQDAFSVMRSLGLGVSTRDLNSYAYRVPARLVGRIILKVQDKGQAYYVDPVQKKLYFLGRPQDAFSVMRARGLGITNSDLNSIAIAATALSVQNKIMPTVSRLDSDGKDFKFRFQANEYDFRLPLSSALYDSYKNTTKLVTYETGNEPANLREVFYGLFLKLKADDTSVHDIVTKLKKVAKDNNWNDDQTVEFVFSFVQYIPYDQSKVSSGSGANDNPYFPYETLYLNKGVCSDKTFLAVLLMRELGYGAAVLDFPERNHTALGIACPVQYSLNNSGYCYGETTNYFPLGIIPQNLANGQAQTADEFSNSFAAGNLGKLEIYQTTTGKIYQGMPALQARVDALQVAKGDLSASQGEINTLNTALVAQEAAIKAMKVRVDSYYNNGQIKEYNNMVPGYNSLVNQYNVDLAVFKSKVNERNAKLALFNAAVKAFYQQ